MEHLSLEVLVSLINGQHQMVPKIGGTAGGVPELLLQFSHLPPALREQQQTEHTTRTSRDMHSTIWERKQSRPTFTEVGKTSTIWSGRPSDSQRLPSPTTTLIILLQ
jgi:hypothetical protein